MQLEGILGLGYTEPVKTVTSGDKREENASVPLSWQNDTVSISDAAKAAQQAASAEDEQQEDDPAAMFSDYMKKARGQDGGASSGDPEEQIKALQEKLQKLTSQMEQTAKEDGTPDSAKSSKMEAISAEINQVISQIAELQAQVAAAKAG